jgi:hypothetical protein
MNDETQALNDLDAPPVNGLESIFVLPDALAADSRILGWYNEMALQLRREAQGVPMQAAQYALMERICYTYAYMRYRELTDTVLNERERQANQDSWQKMIEQFNRLLEKHNDKVVNDLLVNIQNILKKRLTIVTDPTERATLRRALGEDFAALGI